MALFDGFQFAPQAYGGQSGGLLDLLRTLQTQPTASNGFDPVTPPDYGQTANLRIGNYVMPQFGTASSDPAALPPTSQPTQGQMPAASSNGSQDSPLMAGLGSFVGNLHNGPIGALAGGLAGLLTGQRTDAYGVEQAKLKKVQNLTIQALRARGVPEPDIALAAANPEVFKALLPRLWPTYKPQVVGNTVGGFDESTGTFKPQYTAPKFEKVGPGDTLYSVGGGATGSNGGGSGAGLTPVASGGPQNPPAGYSYVDPRDPSKGVQAIPGGPGTHLPSETAGRLAMMETASKGLPAARDVLLKGRGSLGMGPAGVFNSLYDTGEVGRAQRTVRTAIEGALRAMTGANAPESEVKRYEDLFMPDPNDSLPTAKQKLDQLDSFISNAGRLVRQGRGPAGNEQPAKKPDPLGVR